MLVHPTGSLDLRGLSWDVSQLQLSLRAYVRPIFCIFSAPFSTLKIRMNDTCQKEKKTLKLTSQKSICVPQKVLHLHNVTETPSFWKLCW